MVQDFAVFRRRRKSLGLKDGMGLESPIAVAIGGVPDYA